MVGFKNQSRVGYGMVQYLIFGYGHLFICDWGERVGGFEFD